MRKDIYVGTTLERRERKEKEKEKEKEKTARKDEKFIVTWYY